MKITGTVMMMSDNRTTELESITKLKMAGKLRFWRRAIEIPEDELHAICDEIQAEHEQAIAATLGRPKAKSHPYGYERDTGAYDCTRCECGCINDISAKYCNDCGGEIEIDESAEKEYYDGCSKHMVFAKKHDDGSLELCERRYVPEESATRGALTAEQVEKAIRDCSTYASYDGCTYYASGIRLQAIADELNAELGSDDEYEAKMDALLCRLTNGKWSKSHAYSLDFMVSCIDEEYEELYEKERAELGNGTLTAEQVMSIARKHQPDYCSDTHVCFDWQAIADELNAELGSGMCELEPLSALDVTLNMLDSVEWGACSECGCAVPMDAKFCNECGKAVKR